MPAALTLHDIDDDLYTALRANADSLGTSMNRAAKALLASALGLVRRKKEDHDKELSPFFGGLDNATWSRAKAAIAEFRRIEPEDWS